MDAGHHQEEDQQSLATGKPAPSTNERAGAGSRLRVAQHPEGNLPDQDIGFQPICQKSLKRLHTEEEEFRQWLRRTSVRQECNKSDYAIEVFSGKLQGYCFSFIGTLSDSQKHFETLQLADQLAFPLVLLFVIQVGLGFWLLSRSRQPRIYARDSVKQSQAKAS